MNSTIDILFLRRPQLDYVSPAVCEVLFSSSGGPIIVLDPLDVITGITGLVWGGVGGFRLSWNSYPGAICYSVYKLVDELNPFGPYAVIAECISDNFFDADDFGDGTYKVSVITPDGETPLSDIIVISHPAPPSLPSPKLYWTFDTDLKESITGTDFIQIFGGGVQFFIPGKIDNGVQFVAEPGDFNEFVNNDSSLVLDVTNGFSITGWVNLTPADGNNPFWTLEANWGDATSIGLQINSDGLDSGLNITFSGTNESLDVSSVSLAFPGGSLVFIRAWWDSADSFFRIQLNNGAIYTSSTPLALESGVVSSLFLLSNGTTQTDEMGFFTPKITDGEATALYNGGAGARPPLPP